MAVGSQSSIHPLSLSGNGYAPLPFHRLYHLSAQSDFLSIRVVPLHSFLHLLSFSLSVIPFHSPISTLLTEAVF